MLELYVFIATLAALTVIIGRRHWIRSAWKKSEFKKKITSQVDALRQQDQLSPEERFKDRLEEEQKQKKWSAGPYKEFMRKAEFFLAKKEWENAQTFLIQALSLSKNEIPVLLKLAGVSLELKETHKAEHFYERLLELGAELPDVYLNLAKIQTQKKHYKEAIKYLVKAVELNEKDDGSLAQLGKLYQLLMRPGLAAECFRRAAELKPREVDYLFLLAEACKADEDFDNALFTYEKILLLEPYNEKAIQAIQAVRLKRKETEVVIRKLETLSENRKQYTGNSLILLLFFVSSFLFPNY